MAIDWLRLWHDMPTDPKFRVVAKRSGRPLSEVVAVFVMMLTNASANASERGTLSNWSDEDVAAALDMEPENVSVIFQAMQGKVLDGGKLSGWEKRQPKREDGSSERAKAWRERKRTQTTENDRLDKIKSREEEIREESNSTPVLEAARERAGGPPPVDEIQGLNGATAEIVVGVARMFNQLAPDLVWARRQVSSNVAIYGHEAVRDGYAELMADVADNKVSVPSHKTLVGYFKTAKERRDRGAAKAAAPGYQPRPGGVLELIQRREREGAVA